MQVLDRHPDVNDAEEAEDEGLNDTDDHAENHHGEGQEEDTEAQEDSQDGVISNHVTAEAEGQAEGAREVTDDLDQEDEWRENQERPTHVLEMLKPILLDPVNVGREEHDERHHDVRGDDAGGGSETRQEAGEVREEDKEGHRPDKREEVARGLSAHDALHHPQDSLTHHLYKASRVERYFGERAILCCGSP